MSFDIYHQKRLTARVNARLQQVKGEGSMRLARSLEKVYTDGNRRDRLLALDRFGRRMPPRKKPRRDRANGPVMSPHRTSSGDIKGYFVRVTRKRDGWTLVAGIRDAAYYAFHAEGMVRGAPVRDVLGTTPRVHGLARREFHAFQQGEFKYRRSR